ncbi:MAG: PhoX family protein [Bradymonadia bacterium]
MKRTDASTQPIDLATLIHARLSRRGVLGGLAGMGAIAGMGGLATGCQDKAGKPASPPPKPASDAARAQRDATSATPAQPVESLAPAPKVTFKEVPHALDAQLTVPEGYNAQVLLRWGDPIHAGMTPLDLAGLTAEEQGRRMGYNNDFIAFHPLPYGSKSSTRGLLSINNEYTNPSLMFPSLGKDDGAALTSEQVAVDMLAHGHTLVEVALGEQGWSVVLDSRYNRRLTPLTPMGVSGPAAGHRRMKTAADPEGTAILGTFSNCAGGQTPWGTTLIAEENFQKYFGGNATLGDEAKNHELYGLRPSKTTKDWYMADERFNIEKTPHEPNRHGWIVELDPFDPESKPMKRTALGRFKHECATTVHDASGRVAIYSGDDQRFQFVYKFVSAGTVNTEDRKANGQILDDGVLYAARFEADGAMKWLPLVFGKGPLTEENGFKDQGDVLIETRRAAMLMGATPMDRPEDVEVDPITGRIYVMLTQNRRRTPGQADDANPRGPNLGGHILEIIPPKGQGEGAASVDHVSETCTWDVLLLGGNPKEKKWNARFHPDTSENGWLVNPDNGAFDMHGRLWVATDTANDTAGIADGLYACPVRGPERALTRRFMRVPIGAELCGPCFTPDCTTLFVSVQHPGEGTHLDDPNTRWPDFDKALPPRPSVVAIRHGKGEIIGT